LRSRADLKAALLTLILESKRKNFLYEEKQEDLVLVVFIILVCIVCINSSRKEGIFNHAAHLSLDL